MVLSCNPMTNVTMTIFGTKEEFVFMFEMVLENKELSMCIFINYQLFYLFLLLCTMLAMGDRSKKPKKLDK